MNRETKIGLLVGLAFIIVVAILLTDHTTTATDPRPASLPDVGSNVRQSVATPAAPPPPVDAPRSPIPTRADLATARAEPARPPVRIVEVGPGSESAPPIAISQSPADSAAAADSPPSLPPIDNVRPAGGRSDKPAPRGGPGDLVARHPDDLVDVPADPAARTAGATKAGGKPATAPIVPPKTYVAAAGDTVSKIATKAMGGNSKANRDALIKANPSLQNEGNLVYAGKSYVVPSAGATAQAAEQAAARKQQQQAVAPSAGPFKAPPPSAANTVWYTVKENDNLWRIASRELGDGNRWAAIKDINKDVLRGGETVKANMRIRLPKPAAATASVD